MKTLLALIILFGGCYYLYTLRQENARIREENARLLEQMDPKALTPEQARLYGSRPLVTEATGMIRKRVICPQCKGEGAVMVRRPVDGSVTDVKSLCGLCMGAGKREFDMNPAAEICPDCGGMGKRAMFSTKSRQMRGIGVTGLDGPSSGFSEQAPTSTSCPRCLGRGAIVRPGLR